MQRLVGNDNQQLNELAFCMTNVTKRNAKAIRVEEKVVPESNRDSWLKKYMPHLFC